jgi:thiol-disulfide isomerase/thioredoxin
MKLSKCLTDLLKMKYLKMVVLVLIGYLLFRFIQGFREGFESNPATFTEDIKDGKKFVWFYADWCGHCKTMHDAWDTAAKKVNAAGKNIMMKINVGDAKNKNHQQLSKKYGIDGFPTIMMLDNGKKTGEYAGPRTADDFEKYCKSNGLI